jgi:hypothetical protein
MMRFDVKHITENEGAKRDHPPEPSLSTEPQSLGGLGGLGGLGDKKRV